jgi:hypothetical protein
VLLTRRCPRPPLREGFPLSIVLQPHETPTPLARVVVIAVVLLYRSAVPAVPSVLLLWHAVDPFASPQHPPPHSLRLQSHEQLAMQRQRLALIQEQGP